MSAKAVFYRPESWKNCGKTHYAPLGLMSIAAYIRKFGIQSVIIDYCDESPIQELIKQSKDAAFIGITTKTCEQISGALEAARAIREVNKTVPLVWGGWHPSMAPKQTCQHELVDIVVKGLGEETCLELMEAFNNGKELKEIKGICYKDRNGRVVQNPDRSLPNSIDDYPMLAYDLINIDNYNVLVQENEQHSIPSYLFTQRLLEELDSPPKIINYTTSHGCPCNCGFCCVNSIYKRKWLCYSPERVVDEITALNKQYGINVIIFDDAHFFTNLKRVRRICEIMIDSGMTIKWSATLRADYTVKMDQDIWKLLKKAGLIGVFLGAESGSESTMNIVGKGYDIGINEKAAHILNENKIFGSFSYILGIPGEDKRSLWLTLRQAQRIASKNENIFPAFSAYTSLPGSDLHHQVDDDRIFKPKELSEWAKISFQKPNSKTLSLNDYNKMKVLNAIYQIRFEDGLKSIPVNFIILMFKALAYVRLKLRTTSVPIDLRLYCMIVRAINRAEKIASGTNVNRLSNVDYYFSL